MERRVPIILLIEHDPIDRATLTRMLKDAGYSVIPARGAADALETFVTHHIDIALVLADAAIPDLGGPQLLDAIHTIDARIPVVMLTTVGLLDRSVYQRPNLAGTIGRPVSSVELIARVQHGLQASRAANLRHSAPSSAIADAYWSSVDRAFDAPHLDRRDRSPVATRRDRPFDWPPRDEDLADIDVVDTGSWWPSQLDIEPIEPVEPIGPAFKERSAIEPLEILEPLEAGPVMLVPIDSPDPRAQLVVRLDAHRARVQRRYRWLAVAAAALCGVTFTTLLEQRGERESRALARDADPPPWISTVPASRRMGPMKLVPAERVHPRAIARVFRRAPQRNIDPIRPAPRRPTPLLARRTPPSTARPSTPPTPAAATAASATAAPKSVSVPALVSAPVPAPSASSPLPVDTAPQDEQQIYRTLARYERAYELLDVEAARAVWPTLNTRALARAFDGLKKQVLEFSSCRVAMQNREATAVCGGRTTYVPRIGHQTSRTESREWTFRLQKVDQNWLISKAEARAR